MNNIPGFTLRNDNGELVGFKCPFSLRCFYGEDSERQQYHHSKAIADEYGGRGMSIPDVRNAYQRANPKR